MDTRLTVRHMENNTVLQNHFEEKVGNLSTRFSVFRNDAITVHCNIDKNPHKEEYDASLTVHLPSHSLHSRASGFDAFGAMNGVFETMKKQVDKCKTKIVKGHKRSGSRADWDVTTESQIDTQT